jgi:xanthine dehydrogenase accessory factor
MRKELELWQFVSGRLRRDEDVMLLIVAESTGSSPGRQGFKMAVAADELCGSIGGGIMEVNLVEQARAVLSVPSAVAGGLMLSSASWEKDSRLAAVIPQIHRKGDKNSSGMICSGKQTVIFKALTTNDAATINAIIESLENRQPHILTVAPEQFRVAPPKGGTQNADFTFEAPSDTDFEFTERLGYKNDLYIIGGGHCALALSELISKMDFYIRLFDDRPELNTISKNTFVHEKHVIESYERIAERIPGAPNAYVVVMTVGFKSDEVVIRSLLDKEFRYFGVLGSKAKMAQLMKNLRDEGHAKEQLDRIRTPIGLPINSQTPEEIAVSIAAEIISVKNSKKKV